MIDSVLPRPNKNPGPQGPESRSWPNSGNHPRFFFLSLGSKFLYNASGDLVLYFIPTSEPSRMVIGIHPRVFRTRFWSVHLAPHYKNSGGKIRRAVLFPERVFYIMHTFKYGMP